MENEKRLIDANVMEHQLRALIATAEKEKKVRIGIYEQKSDGVFRAVKRHGRQKNV